MSQPGQVDHGADLILEISATGPIDEQQAEAAPVIAFHLDGSLPPLFMIRTWSDEIPKQRNLAANLGPDQPMYSIAPPRGQAMEDFPTSPQEWCDFVTEQLLRIPHEGPYLLGGWSFGGVIGLDVAERLAADGKPVQLLAMLDTRIPTDHPKTARGERKVRRLNKFAKRLLEFSDLDTRTERMAFLRWRIKRYFQKIGKKLRKQGRKLLGRREPEKPQQVISEGQVFTGPRGRKMSYLKRAIRIAYLKHQRRIYHVPVALLWCQESLEAEGSDAALGWGPYLRGSLEIQGAPGTHLSMLNATNAPGAAERLARMLRHARESGQVYSGPPGPVPPPRIRR